jgi:hypothetical protein
MRGGSIRWVDPSLERASASISERTVRKTPSRFPLDRPTRLDLYAPFFPDAPPYKEGCPDH